MFNVWICLFKSKSVYEKNCLACHNKIPVSIDKYFYRYLFEYSSEKDVKEAMFFIFKKSYIRKKFNVGIFNKKIWIKKKTKLSDEVFKRSFR